MQRLILSALLYLLAQPAWAQACAAERSAHSQVFQAYYNRSPNVDDSYFTRPCNPADVEYHGRAVEGVLRQVQKWEVDRATAPNASNRVYADMNIKGALLKACEIRAFLDRCRGASAPAATVPSAPRPTAPQAAPAPAPAASLRDTMGEAPEGQLATEPASAARRAIDRQASVEFHRGDKRKRHVPGAEAHKCLTVSKVTGLNNSCDFAVEFSFCIFRPEEGSWSEFFDCEKGKSGSWQVSANKRASVHTWGEYVHWFACRYGPTLGKPDGISPADVEYMPDSGVGRLHGRCAQWGAETALVAATAPPDGRVAGTAGSQQPAGASAETARPANQPAAQPAQPAFVPETCTRADRGSNRKIQQWKNGPFEYCSCIPSPAYDAKTCSCLKYPRGAGC